MEHEPSEFRTSRLPGGNDITFGWSIRRADANVPRKLICLGDDIFGCYTHFFRGRTTPCRTDSCEACDRKITPRYHGYICTVDIKDSTPTILEFTGPAALQFDQLRKEYGTLRGVQIIVGRANKRPNSRVNIVGQGVYAQPQKLPAEIPIWPLLAHIWGLDREAPIGIEDNPEDDGGTAGLDLTSNPKPILPLKYA